MKRPPTFQLSNDGSPAIQVPFGASGSATPLSDPSSPSLGSPTMMSPRNLRVGRGEGVGRVIVEAVQLRSTNGHVSRRVLLRILNDMYELSFRTIHTQNSDFGRLLKVADLFEIQLVCPGLRVGMWRIVVRRALTARCTRRTTPGRGTAYHHLRTVWFAAGPNWPQWSSRDAACLEAAAQHD